MTPHTAGNGRGTLTFDRVFHGVGRIRTASGTKDQALFKKMNRMLTRLFEERRLDVLIAIAKARLSPLEVFELYQGGDLSALPKGGALEPLKAPWGAWVDRTENKKTHTARRLALPTLAPYLPSLALPAHLPVALRSYRLVMVDEEKPAQFNRVRATVLAFLRDTVGKQDGTYLEVIGIGALKELKRKRLAPTILRALQIAEALGADAGAMWWTTVLTGMGPDEYFEGKWQARPPHQVQIQGTKREARDRVVPYIEPLAAPRIHLKTYEKRLAELATSALGLDVEPYDGRRAFRHLVEEAGIPATRIKQLMGHSLKLDVTDGYGGVELTAFSEADGERIRVVIAEARRQLAASKRGSLKVG